MTFVVSLLFRDHTTYLHQLYIMSSWIFKGRINRRQKCRELLEHPEQQQLYLRFFKSKGQPLVICFHLNTIFDLFQMFGSNYPMRISSNHSTPIQQPRTLNILILTPLHVPHNSRLIDSSVLSPLVQVTEAYMFCQISTFQELLDTSKKKTD